MREAFIAAMVVVAGGWLVWIGDQYGTNAQQVARWKLEIADTNRRIAEFTSADNQASTDADALRNEGYEKARSELASAEKCVVTPAMSASFRRIAR